VEGWAAAAAEAGLATEAEMRRKGCPGMSRKEAQSSHSFFHTPFLRGWGVGIGLDLGFRVRWWCVGWLVSCLADTPPSVNRLLLLTSPPHGPPLFIDRSTRRFTHRSWEGPVRTPSRLRWEESAPCAVHGCVGLGSNRAETSKGPQQANKSCVEAYHLSSETSCRGPVCVAKARSVGGVRVKRGLLITDWITPTEKSAPVHTKALCRNHASTDRSRPTSSSSIYRIERGGQKRQGVVVSCVLLEALLLLLVEARAACSPTGKTTRMKR
jgi:hypothetical protein